MICLMASSLPVTSAGASDDIPTNAAATGDHDTLVAALSHVGLVATLQGSGPFTVFAPTDDAFANAGIDIADFNTQEEKDALTDILLYHVIDSEVTSSAVTDGMTATMVNGDTASFTVADGKVSIGDASVTLADVPASNGVIHVIDTVLMPPQDITEIAQSTGIHNALVAAIVQADLLSTLQGDGPFTVFAPTDQAFIDAEIDLNALDTPEGKDALTNILMYHVVDGEVPSSAVTDCLETDALNSDPLSFSVGDKVMVNDAIVTLPDIPASNGVIHVIDKVLTPTKTPTDIPRTAQCTGVHNTLVDAVLQAELLTILQGPGPFTLFAPTDQAFIDANIDLALLDTPEGKVSLTHILEYHLISGEVLSSDLTDGMVATAISGDELTVDLTSGVKINEATVTNPDVATSNGVIHVIDKVLMPTGTPNDTVRTAVCTSVHTSLVAALIQAELVETLQGDGPFTVFAPSDQAFAAAGINLTSYDSASGKENLTDILLYHVYAGTFNAADIVDGDTLQMVNGDNVTISASPAINGAGITTADVLTSNGVIHVIDKVLMPPAEEVDTPIDDEDDTSEGEGTGDKTSSDEDDDDDWMTYLYIGIGILVLAGIGGILFMRRDESGGDISNNLSQGGLAPQMSMSEGTIFSAQPSSGQTTATAYSAESQTSYDAQTNSAAQTSYLAQELAEPVQQPQPVVTQPVVAQPQVLQQWTDAGGHTWRQMDDGSMMWWNGTDWQPAA